MSASRPPGVRQWIWRAFVQSALVPLLLVEIGFIAIYLLSNDAIRDAQIEHLRETALSDLRNAADTQTRLMEEKLRHVADTTDLYRSLTAQALDSKGPVPEDDEPLVVTADGVRYSARDTGGPASFYSNATPLFLHDMTKVARLSLADNMMRVIHQQNPMVTSVYFNGWDNYNRIYPWMDTAATYPHDLMTARYNFYYLADAAHNPSREVVWTDVYLDPAGRGWMLSAVAPVYRNDFLEGVTGIDITVASLLKQMGRLELPWNGYAVLVSDTLNVMALPAAGETDFGLTELTAHTYHRAISDDTFKPDDFNLAKRDTTRPLAKAIAAAPEGVMSIELDGRKRLVAWATVDPTGWHLLSVIDEQSLFYQTDAMADRYERIGLLLIAGLSLFYLLCSLFMWWRSRRLSHALLQPISGISQMMAAIGQGQWRPARPEARIGELQRMVEDTASMGEKLQQSEASLRKANADALASNLAKSKFISSISHELRTPLNAIQGFAQLLQLETSENRQRRSELLGEIVSASRHLNQLLGDILEWSGAQNERRRIELAPIALRGLFKECGELVRLDAEGHGLRLDIELPDANIGVVGDARRLRQVLLNLLSNAIKYNRKGGQVTLGCQVEGSVARLWVRDTGIGIDPALHERLFEPFQRLGQESSNIPGTGIGLSLCREYVRQMKGRIGVDSSVGGGSEFWVELPATVIDMGIASVRPLPIAAPVSAKPRVVYVEDDRASQMLIIKALQDIADVEAIADGANALEHVFDNPPDLILLDLNIPGMRGSDVVQRLRTHPKTASLPIVMVTAALESEFERLSTLDCQGLLRKPVELDELRRTVASLLTN
ncbi:ATP-binding protein [Pseudomonas matsuisoli]|uniref:histidine kinase n=1 Tax=Pseudomonas matsuisoli TaxID=1515666 RepID=A0A917PRS6_9PSED|nr:ATP-binding protein [Pseudomonas matsuisoli]GGJ89044.1 histidine kinase [Pseudomonas matsuisoli]